MDSGKILIINLVLQPFPLEVEEMILVLMSVRVFTVYFGHLLILAALRPMLGS
jgi:hypothetical protein